MRVKCTVTVMGSRRSRGDIVDQVPNMYRLSPDLFSVENEDVRTGSYCVPSHRECRLRLSASEKLTEIIVKLNRQKKSIYNVRKSKLHNTVDR
jgi:hypothetical protein